MYHSSDIITAIILRRIRGAGHVRRKEEMRKDTEFQSDNLKENI
jgi:hypothetical protein